MNLYQRWAPVPACTAVCALSCLAEEHLPQTHHRGACTHQVLPCSCPSSTPSWGHHWARAESITSSSCPALQQVGSPSIYRNAFSCDHLWPQSAKCNPATAPGKHGRGSTHLLLLWADPVLCPQGILYCCLILFCKWASANFHSVRTSKFYVCNSWLVKRK